MPTKSASKQLTVSIVSYNTKTLLKRCLASIFKYTQNINFEVIVVDNASTDGSTEMVAKNFPQVRLIRNLKNNFYTGANNQALKLARGKYFIILNSDIFLKTNAFKEMVDYLEANPGVGAIEPLQLYEDGRIVKTGSRHDSLWHSLTELTLLYKFIRPKSLNSFRLKNLNREKTWTADVICDAAMMLRTSLFRKIGGYDQNFKLYYTENDLCRRLQALGFKTVHFAGSRVWHRVSASTDKVGWKTISPIYSQDAFQYYLKYHGWLQALIIWLGMKISNFLVQLKQNFWLVLILILAAILRFYDLNQSMIFIGDQGRDYLTARNWLLGGSIPLVGIDSSVPWLKQGPFFIWLIALSLKLANFHPVAPAVLTAGLGVLAVYLVYYFSHNYLAALVMATAPLNVLHDRMPYHTSLIPFFTILYLLALKAKSINWSFILVGVLLQFELTTLPLLFLTILKFKRLSFLWLIPFIPKFIYDFNHGFTQTLGFGAWTVHKFFEVKFSAQFISTTFEFWRKFTLWDYPVLAAILGLIALIFVFKQKLFLTFLSLNLLAFFIHGSPSEAYFPVLFPVWALILALPKSKIYRFLIICLCFYNALFLVKNQFNPYHQYGLSLAEQYQQIKSWPRPIKLMNPPDIPFPSYLDNYRYLLWYSGIEYENINVK